MVLVVKSVFVAFLYLFVFVWVLEARVVVLVCIVAEVGSRVDGRRIRYSFDR